MASEAEEKYFLGNSISKSLVIEKVYAFHKSHKQYPARVILNPKYQHIGGSPHFIPFETILVPAIRPLENRDIEVSDVQGYYVDVEYNEEMDEEALICRGFARIL